MEKRSALKKGNNHFNSDTYHDDRDHNRHRCEPPEVCWMMDQRGAGAFLPFRGAFPVLPPLYLLQRTAWAFFQNIVSCASLPVRYLGLVAFLASSSLKRGGAGFFQNFARPVSAFRWEWSYFGFFVRFC
ncbi:MAG: hypothetical protein QG599_927 [Pseudomonadota bacterium]|nr:hypothetical protein [Pseudomonadota bacterium]